MVALAGALRNVDLDKMTFLQVPSRGGLSGSEAGRVEPIFDQAQLIFDAMAMIRNNWTHYRRLYSNNQPTYRNDHALSISLCMLNGHTIDHPIIPWNLASVTHSHKLSQISEDHYRIDFVNQEQKPRWVEVKDCDFHAMGKGHLGEIIANTK
jgi:hypothetical protein